MCCLSAAKAAGMRRSFFLEHWRLTVGGQRKDRNIHETDGQTSCKKSSCPKPTTNVQAPWCGVGVQQPSCPEGLKSARFVLLEK